MIPGVTYLPVPSMTTASAGAVIDAPTATIFPFRSSTEPFGIDCPAAVMIVALRIKVVRLGNGLYVLGKGFAFGDDVPPGPGGVDGALSGRAVSFGGGVCGSVWVANPSNTHTQATMRIIELIFILGLKRLKVATFSYKRRSLSNIFSRRRRHHSLNPDASAERACYHPTDRAAA